MKILLAMILLLLQFNIPEVAAGELDPALEMEASQVFEGMMSPFCPGRLLRDCPSTSAHELKDKIRGMISEGKSREEILDQMAVLYGEHIRSSPPTKGFGLVGWLTPAMELTPEESARVVKEMER